MKEKKVLIIDEEGISVRSILWEIDNYFSNVETKVCKSCSKGLNEFRTGKYDAIILDIQLPKGDIDFENERHDMKYGLDVLEIIKKENQKQPVICYTVLDDEVSDIIKNRGAIHLCKLADNSSLILMKNLEKIFS